MNLFDFGIPVNLRPVRVVAIWVKQLKTAHRTSVCCFYCEKAGHRAEDCEEPDTCSVCRSYDYRESHCPHLVYSGNVESEIYQYVSSPKSYAGAPKSPLLTEWLVLVSRHSWL